MPANKNPQTPRPPFDPGVLLTAKPRRWEYMTIVYDGPFGKTSLNEYGADRWELVQIYTQDDPMRAHAYHAVFKREVV